MKRAILEYIAEFPDGVRSLSIITNLKSRGFWFVEARAYTLLRKMERNAELRSWWGWSVVARREVRFYGLYLESIPGFVASVNEMTTPEAIAKSISAEDLGY